MSGNTGCPASLYFYPRAPGGARLEYREPIGTAVLISIRVPREGHDCPRAMLKAEEINFYPRAPGGARRRGCRGWFSGWNFYPRAPGGARPMAEQWGGLETTFLSACPGRGTTLRPRGETVWVVISIHVPREGHDASGSAISSVGIQFLSTCPVRGTTAPFLKFPPQSWNFYPRAPRGARLDSQKPKSVRKPFLPTCPARGTTSPTTRPSPRLDVFLPTCPARGTTSLRGIIVSVFIFLPTCPGRGTTRRRPRPGM